MGNHSIEQANISTKGCCISSIWLLDANSICICAINSTVTFYVLRRSSFIQDYSEAKWESHQSLVPLALCEENQPVAGGFSAQRASNAERVPCHDVIVIIPRYQYRTSMRLSWRNLVIFSISVAVISHNFHVWNHRQLCNNLFKNMFAIATLKHQSC